MQVYGILQPFMMSRPGVNPASVADTVDLAGKDDDDGNGGRGGVGGVVGVGVMPEGNHTGRERKSGKPGGTGLLMVEAMNKLAESKDGTLEAIGISIGDLSTGVKGMTGSLSRMAESFEEGNKQQAKVAAAQEKHLEVQTKSEKIKAKHLEVQTLNEKIKAIGLLKQLGGISDAQAQSVLAAILPALIAVEPRQDGPEEQADQTELMDNVGKAGPTGE